MNELDPSGLFLADTNKNETKKKQINKEPTRNGFLNP
jgi:hypothetical protein